MGALRVHKPLAGQGDTAPPLINTLSEAFPQTAADAAATGFILNRLAHGTHPILWVQDRLSRKEAGRPSLLGVGTKRPIIMVDVSRAVDVLWAMEDGLRCKTLGSVIGEIWGDPPALSFTATKRLAIRAEASGIPCWLIRRAARPDLSAARDRWRIGSLPSAAHPYDAQAPGASRWSLDLFRSRRVKPGSWVATYDRAADRFDLSSPTGDRTVGAGDGTMRQRAAG